MTEYNKDNAVLKTEFDALKKQFDDATAQIVTFKTEAETNKVTLGESEIKLKGFETLQTEMTTLKTSLEEQTTLVGQHVATLAEQTTQIETHKKTIEDTATASLLKRRELLVSTYKLDTEKVKVMAEPELAVLEAHLPSVSKLSAPDIKGLDASGNGRTDTDGLRGRELIASALGKSSSY